MEPTCSIEECWSPVFVVSRGWCKKHYTRWHRTGDPLAAAYDRRDGTPEQRWLAKVDKTETCWLWTGSLDKHGYGQFDVTIAGKHRNHRAHRWGYQLLVRPLAGAETLDHLCRVPACVRPEHLEPVSHAENVARGEAGLHNGIKTHCPQGHPYDEQNTYHRPAGGRGCRACSRTRLREYMRVKRAKQRAEATPPD